MKIFRFDYELPETLIAQDVTAQRDHSRLLVMDKMSFSYQHRQFADIKGFMKEGDLLVLNNTKVMPARTRGVKRDTGGLVEVLFIEPAEPNQWLALLKSSKRPKPGTPLILGEAPPLAVTFHKEGQDGECIVAVPADTDIPQWLESNGSLPLPPYIQRNATTSVEQTERDRERYQTVFASEIGAVAAPTAGLHFTPALLQSLADKGIEQTELTLHVGPGTFRPVKAENIEDHHMHAERYHVSQDAVDAIRRTKERGGRIIAVGSTAVRTLETIAQHPSLEACEGSTDIFITPGHTFQLVDAMITNFHLPKSTLLMMVAAFAGTEEVLAAYQEAIRLQYRFFSYGDAMLIH